MFPDFDANGSTPAASKFVECACGNPKHYCDLFECVNGFHVLPFFGLVTSRFRDLRDNDSAKIGQLALLPQQIGGNRGEQNCSDSASAVPSNARNRDDDKLQIINVDSHIAASDSISRQNAVSNPVGNCSN